MFKKKNKYIVYGSHTKLAKMTPIKLDIAGQVIEHIVIFKYLGIWLDECMSFKEHIQRIAARISCKIGLISRARRYLSLEHSKMLFNAIVFPHFDYCSQVWTNASKPHLNIIIKLHKRARKILLQVPKRTHTHRMFYQI